MSAASLTPEARLLALALTGAGADERVRLVLEGGVDWAALGWLADRERATAILWKRLSALPSALVPAAEGARLRQLAMVSDFQMLRLERRLDETLSHLTGAGIEVLLLKGAALASTLYPSFALRPMNDLDLLVRGERAAEAWEVIRGCAWRGEHEAGLDPFYAGHQHLPPLYDADGTGIRLELHTALFPEGHPFDLPVDALWTAAEPVPGRRGIHTLALHHQLLHLCLHFAWSHMLATGFWRTFRDVGVLIGTGRLDWEGFVRLAGRSRGASCCYWALRLGRSLGGLGVPEGVLAALRPPGPEWLHARLERHFILELCTPGGSCPSVWLRSALWEVAVRPRWSGHGEFRPWTRTPLFEAGAGAGETPLRARGGVGGGRVLVSAWRHLRGGRAWARYLGRLTGPPSTAARRASVSRRAISSRRGRSAPASSERTTPSR